MSESHATQSCFLQTPPLRRFQICFVVGRFSFPNPASSLFIFQSLLWVLSICFCEWTQYLNATLPQVSVFESLLSIFISWISPLSLLSINVTSMLKTQLCDSSHQQSSDLQTHVPNPYSTSPLAIQ